MANYCFSACCEEGVTFLFEDPAITPPILGKVYYIESDSFSGCAVNITCTDLPIYSFESIEGPYAACSSCSGNKLPTYPSIGFNTIYNLTKCACDGKGGVNKYIYATFPLGVGSYFYQLSGTSTASDNCYITTPDGYYVRQYEVGCSDCFTVEKGIVTKVQSCCSSPSPTPTPTQTPTPTHTPTPTPTQTSLPKSDFVSGCCDNKLYRLKSGTKYYVGNTIAVIPKNFCYKVVSIVGTPTYDILDDTTGVASVTSCYSNQCQSCEDAQVGSIANDCEVLTVLPLGITCNCSNPQIGSPFSGILSVIITGGTAPYNVIWTTPQNQYLIGQTQNGVSGGTYTVTVHDYYNLTATAQCVIVQQLNCEYEAEISEFILPTTTPTPTPTFTPTPTKTPTPTPTVTPSSTPPTPFISVWKTTSSDETITLPLQSNGNYSFRVKWGDGQEDYITSYGQPEVTHTYHTPGTHTIYITGIIDGFSFNKSGDNEKIYEIIQWGPLKLGNNTGYFKQCFNIVFTGVTDVLDLSSTNNLTNMFDEIGDGLTFVKNMNSWDMSNIRYLSNMFQANRNFNQDLNGWNTSNVTDMVSVFNGCDNFNGNITSWDTSSVTNMSGMFWGANNFNQNIGNWDTSNVNDMSFMFYQASVFNQNIGNWDVSNVVYMNQMFREATVFNNNNSSLINNWNVSNVNNMEAMFSDATAFNQPINNWNISNVTSFDFFMQNKTNLNYNSVYLTAIYNSWSLLSVQPNLTINFGTIKYTVAGQTGKNILTSAPKNWTITDGGT